MKRSELPFKRQINIGYLSLIASTTIDFMAQDYDFKVIDIRDKDNFEQQVKQMLSDGYELHGSMSAFQAPDGVHYVQALKKNVAERTTLGFGIKKGN